RAGTLLVSKCARQGSRDMAAQGRRNNSHSRDGREEHDMSGKSQIDRRGFLRNASGAALGAAAAGSIAPLSSPARAQEKFPARDISWIIYQAPGGSIDTTARIIQPYLEKQGVKTSLDYVLGAGGRVARTKLYTARPDGYVMMTESAPRRDRRGHRAGGLQGERVHRDLRMERGELAALREEGFADPDLPAIRRRVPQASRGGGHHRAFGIEPHPARGVPEGIEPAVWNGAFRGLGQSLSGGHGRPCRRGDQRTGIGLAHAREPAFSRRHRRGARKGAARCADAQGIGLSRHAHRSDLV